MTDGVNLQKHQINVLEVKTLRKFTARGPWSKMFLYLLKAVKSSVS